MPRSNQHKTLGQGSKLKSGRYRIERLINSGGSGSVYLATDTVSGQQYAVKESRDSDPNIQDQFKREANILLALTHPGLPRVTDEFPQENAQYLVMEYVEGEDCQEIIERTKAPLALATVVGWIHQVCEALTYLHECTPPVIHRDVKPANIRVTPGGQAKLVDFGIAKLYVSGRPTSTAISRTGTQGYSPPEQYSGGTDMRSDIYALGATIYALLTGVEPPDSGGLAAGWQQLTPPRQINPSLPEDVEAVILTAMAVRRDERFSSVRDLWAALRRSSAPPPASPRQLAPEHILLGRQARMRRALQSRNVTRIAAAYAVESQEGYQDLSVEDRNLIQQALSMFPWLPRR